MRICFSYLCVTAINTFYYSINSGQDVFVSIRPHEVLLPSLPQGVSPRDAFICVLEMGGTALTKINRVCDSFGVTRYNIPEGNDQMFEKIKEIEDAITDTKKLLVILEKAH